MAFPNDVKSSQSPLPEVHAFASSTVTTATVVDALKVSGGVLIRGLLTPEEVQQIARDVQPWLDQDKPWNGDFFPPQTRRAYGMMGKSRTFAERIVGNRLWVDVCDELLTSRLEKNWVGDKIESSVSRPQLMNTIVFSIGPQAGAQPLHRDDANQHRYCAAVAEHAMGRDYGIGLFVAGTPTTRQNGATRFIPGSHLWDYHDGPPREEQTVYAELEVGDALVMLSGCYHAGSANATRDQTRLLFSTFTTRGFLRQEENQYLANDVEEVKKLPPWLQERMGYAVSRPFLGWVNLENPMRMLHPDEEEYQRDLW